MKKRNTIWFITESLRIHGRKFDYSVSDYIDATTPIRIRCPQHDYLFEQKSNDHFKSKFPCKYCLKEERNKTLSDGLEGFRIKLEKKFGSNFSLEDSIYVNARTKITITCNKCGSKVHSEPYSILNSKGCRQCSELDNKREFTKGKLIEIQEFVSKLGGYCISTNYNNNEEPLEFICSKGHHFFESWSDVKFSLRWCKECAPNRYIGEMLVRLILEHHLKTRMPSVYLPEMNGLQLDGYSEQLRIAFEYQGHQHNVYSRHFHRSPNQLTKQRFRDNEKKLLCDKNGIQLIEIQEFKTIRRSRIPLFVDAVLKQLDEKKITYSKKPFQVDLERLYGGRESGLYQRAKQIVTLERGTIQNYIGAESKHSITCENGHTFERPLSVIIRTGASCPTCKRDMKFAELKYSVSSRGGQLLDNDLKPREYIELYNWICERGHKNKSKGQYLVDGSWCKTCQIQEQTVEIPLEKLEAIAIDDKLTTEEKARKLGISVGTYYRKLKQSNIKGNPKKQDRRLQNTSTKSKGPIYQIDPVTLEIICEFIYLEAVKRHQNKHFKPEGIRPVLNKIKLAYNYYWCRKDQFDKFIKELKSGLKR